MGGGNGQKAKMAREKNMEKQKAAKGIQGFFEILPFEFLSDLLDLFIYLFMFVGSQLETNKKAMTIQVFSFHASICVLMFVSDSNRLQVSQFGS